MYDADEWQRDNGKQGLVKQYNMMSNLYTIEVDGGGEERYYAREIMKQW